MTPDAPALRISLDGARRETLARERLGALFGRRVRLLGSRGGRAQVRLCSLDALPDTPPNEAVVAVGDADLSSLIALMSARPWLDHVVSPSVFTGERLGGALGETLWRLLTSKRLPSAIFFGKPFRGRKATLRDSAKRQARISAVADFALAAGASSATAERAAEVAEELITNALYDAPAEVAGKANERSTPVLLSGRDACIITYGVGDDMFFVRVRDPFGSLSRARMFQVLGRCAAKSGVALDPSRGGAGLGLWRIFGAASLLVVHVEPHAATEFVVGLALNAPERRRNAEGRARAIHLFFDPAKDDRSRPGLEVAQ